MIVPWPIIISLIVLAFAVLIKHLFSHIIEEENVFLGIVGAFIVIYVSAALAMGALMPKMIATSQADQAQSE